MYMSGIRVDRTTLQKVRHEFEQEKAEIEDRLQRKTRELMGDTPINLNSPEQVSQVIFSRKPLDKAEWLKVFDYDDSGDYKAVAHSKCKDKFHKIVASNTRVIKKLRLILVILVMVRVKNIRKEKMVRFIRYQTNAKTVTLKVTSCQKQKKLQDLCSIHQARNG